MWSSKQFPTQFYCIWSFCTLSEGDNSENDTRKRNSFSSPALSRWEKPSHLQQKTHKPLPSPIWIRAFRDKDEQSSTRFRDSEMHAEGMAKKGKWPRRTVFLLIQPTLSSSWASNITFSIFISTSVIILNYSPRVGKPLCTHSAGTTEIMMRKTPVS